MKALEEDGRVLQQKKESSRKIKWDKKQVTVKV